MTETDPETRLIGYARVSTYGQTLDTQLDQLRAAGCSSRNIYREKVTGARAGRVMQPTGGTAFAAGAVSFSPSAVAGRGWRRGVRGQRRLHRQQAARDRPCRRAGRY